MKVATRITVATAVAVAFASAIYAGFDLRARAAERRAAIEHEGRAVAGTLRSTLETQASAVRGPSDATLRELSRWTGWKVSVFPANRGGCPRRIPSPASCGDCRRCSRSRISRADVEGDVYFQAMPLRAPGQPGDEVEVVGMLEIARPADSIDNTSEDSARAAGLVLLIVAVTTVMVGALATRLVSRPITNVARHRRRRQRRPVHSSCRRARRRDRRRSRRGSTT